MSRTIAPNTIQFDDQRILTRNLAPGQRVYDEELHTVNGTEHRTWNPQRSKLGAYLVKGGRAFDVREDANVVYLGAANGTTPSHVSDIVAKGVLVAVEFSPRSFRDLVSMARPRDNIVPILADAWRPELYERYVGKVDLVFQDIAQRQQAQIFAKNIQRFRPRLGMIAVKSRSVDVARPPRQVYEEVADQIEAETDYVVVDMLDLGPFEKDHAALVVQPNGAGKRLARGAPARQERSAGPPPRPFDQRGGKPYDKRGPPKKAFDKRPRDDRRQGGGGRKGWR